METNKPYFSVIRDLIAKDDISTAIHHLRQLLDKSPLLDEAILQSARFHAIRKQIRLGSVNDKEATLTKNQIRAGLLDLLVEMEEQAKQPEIEKEVRAFNEHLTKTIFQAIHPHSTPALRFWKRISSIEGWEGQGRITDKIKEIIAYSFVGVIGIHLSKLMAIGKEELSEAKQRKYIEKCTFIANKSLDLVNFALLSRLWDTKKQSPLQLSPGQKKVLSNCFDITYEKSVDEQFNLLRTLHEIFTQNALEFPISELEKFNDNLQEDSTFHQACKALDALIFDKVQQYTLLHCFEAEIQLATFFQHFHFLVKYHMASIKEIGYQQNRNAKPYYLHLYAALGIDNKANINAEKINYTPQTIHTDAVLLYKGKDYQNSINLFPFVIDFNALTFERGTKICFYHYAHISDDSLVYQFLEDNSSINIEMKGILTTDTDYNELMRDIEKRKTLNLDNVIAGFQEARQAILGNELILEDL